MARYISLHPESQYTFQTNSSYSSRWNFLSDQQRVKIIAAQLTYLEFHEWLDNNLRHRDPHESELWSLAFDVAEGFVRTDVLLYGSICEAALYAVAKKVVDSNTTTQKPPHLLAAFQTSEQKIHHLGKQTLTLKGNPEGITGKIGICYPKETPKSDSKITFDSLIKAARAINAIDAPLEKRLHVLREARRNTIHLGALITQRQKGRFCAQDRDTAKQVTEETRSQLASYCKTQT
jgi:hypothetical protein